MLKTTNANSTGEYHVDWTGVNSVEAALASIPEQWRGHGLIAWPGRRKGELIDEVRVDLHHACSSGGNRVTGYGPTIIAAICAAADKARRIDAWNGKRERPPQGEPSRAVTRLGSKASSVNRTDDPTREHLPPSTLYDALHPVRCERWHDGEHDWPGEWLALGGGWWRRVS